MKRCLAHLATFPFWLYCLCLVSVGLSIALAGDFTMPQTMLRQKPKHATIVRVCTVTIGDPGAASAVLANDNSSPVACGNTWGVDWRLTAVACYANAGAPTVTPILTGGSATSIVTQAVVCGTASWAPGALANPNPIVHSFNPDSTTCPTTPCTVDMNMTTAGGTAKYVVIKLVGELVGAY